MSETCSKRDAIKTMGALAISMYSKDSDKITRDYLDSLLIETRYLDSVIPDTSFQLFGHRFSAAEGRQSGCERPHQPHDRRARRCNGSYRCEGFASL